MLTAEAPVSESSKRGDVGFSMQRAVLTIATRKLLYLEMAINLARSFLYWHNYSDIVFHIVTDLTPALPKDLKRVVLVHVQPGQLGHGFAPKLHLDQLAPARHTLFVDADCLCLGNLSSVFDRFVGRSVSVVGGTITQGEWFGDVAQLCAHFNVSCLPKFNGGIYYLEPGAKADAVYARARALYYKYDQLGLRRLRGHPTDELLMAIAMALEGCSALPDDGTILGDPFACPILKEIDVLRGKCRLFNPPAPSPCHRNWYPAGEIQPLVVHMLGGFNGSWQYRAEEKKLRLVCERGLSETVAGPWVNWTYQRPAKLMDDARAMLRPTFHRMFGPRKIKVSDRCG